MVLPGDAYEIILDTIGCGVFTIDSDWRITTFNKAAETLIGIRREEAVGRPCREILRGDICLGNCALRETIETGLPIVNRPFELIDSRGKRRPVSISTAVFRDREGRILGGLESFRDLTAIEELRKEISRSYRLADIISRSRLMGRVFELLPKVAETSSTVLIQGESGTGKELTARALHALSGRRNGPFVPVNCAALPDTLLESELFGYKKGAFTDAVTDKKGRIALAEGGTLFLDEIGDISPAFQVKVLRFLQDHTYEPLGAQNTTRADVRILAATNQDLKKLVEKGSFREDLYYRINVVPIRLPPLRSRMEDIPLLVDHFIDRFNALYDKNVRGVSPDTLTLLMGYHYPGNVRELENAIEHAFVLIEGELILPRHLPEHIFFKSGLASGFEFTGDAVKRYQHMEAAFLSHLLAENGHDFRKTARILGVHKTTLYRKMHRLGLSSLLRGRRESAPTF